MTQAPALIRYSGPLTRRLLGAGVPLGPNRVLIVRGRTSGVPRPAPVAVAEIQGRRYVIGTFGNVHWVRNLRAAGEAELAIGGATEHVTARELSVEEGATFFRDTLAGYLDALPLVGRIGGRIFLRIVASDILSDPDSAAHHRPVFELRSAAA